VDPNFARETKKKLGFLNIWMTCPQNSRKGGKKHYLNYNNSARKNHERINKKYNTVLYMKNRE
jgi:hypothetical protein